MPIDLYQIPVSAPCRAVLMTAKEIGLEVNLKFVNLFNGEQYKDEFLKINPQHCIPTIDDDGYYLWESRAIMTYLANKYAPNHQIYPKDAKKRAMIDYFLYFDIGSLYKNVADLVYGPAFRGENVDQDKVKNLKECLSHVEKFLSTSPYLVGETLTLADLSILATLTFAKLIDFDYSEYSSIQRWMTKLEKELPYYDEVNGQPLKEFKKEMEEMKSKK
ncbi:glutathione S-transferase 1-like [Centruroides sculpturatus]|uniref:glutathione S-transferase 1-like n=1 Tax=Centruroides sculpturatus TaxID=218467 RepID=UPI000C6D5973|nr:glutathione S-transferase 1-like [Centruroides sculpturatus]